MRAEAVAEIARRRLSAILRTPDPEVAAEAMGAAVRGGFRVVEFTLTIPRAFELIADFAQRPGLLVGAGTVLEREQVRRAKEAGARFVVSPVFDPEVVAEAGALGLASIPGTFTPAEMLAAHRAGADFVKLFPAPADVARYVAQVLAPLPFLRIFPTAGVTPDNFREVLHAGAVGVGFVGSLFHPVDLESRDFNAIESRAVEIHRRLEQR